MRKVYLQRLASLNELITPGNAIYAKGCTDTSWLGAIGYSACLQEDQAAKGKVISVVLASLEHKAGSRDLRHKVEKAL